MALQRSGWAFLQGEWHEQKFRGNGECREGEGKGSPLVVWRGVKDEVLRLAGLGLGIRLGCLDPIH